jgi:TonB-dependent starch-binding outer membrane protein SusC
MFTRVFKWSLVILVLCISTGIHAQKTIEGKIVDASTKAPIAGVIVSVKGSKLTETSAQDGSYTLSVPENAKTIIFSKSNFESQSIAIENASGSIALKPTEVVVVAYGTRRKTDLTGAVTQVNARDFQKGNVASSEQLLVGKVAGLQITPGGGSAGGGSRIRIRGGASLNSSNDPLIVIDGIPVEGNGIAGAANILNSINPNDIESISVLKDAASTSLYGSRASNGVLIITTKKGTTGKPRINFNTQVSMSQVMNRVGVLDANEFRNVINADALATGNNTWKNKLGGVNTNWQNEILRAGVSNISNISIAGAVKKIPYRVSLGYTSQTGNLLTNNFNRATTALNLAPKFLDEHLSLNINLKTGHTKTRFADEGAVGNALAFDPTQPVKADNKYGGFFEFADNTGTAIQLAPKNPVALLNLRNNEAKLNRIITNAQLDYKLHWLPELHAMVNIGIDYTKTNGRDIIDSTSATNLTTKGRNTQYGEAKKNTLLDLSLLYAKELKSINTKFDILLSHGWQDFVTDITRYASYDLLGTVIPNTTPAFATDKQQFSIESYLGRVNATINDKYLFTASLRRDASSKFAKQNRNALFPSVALAWKLKEELFANNQTVSDLKLRASWGVTGQQDGIGNYSYLTRYTSASNNQAQYQLGNTFYNFLRPSAYDENLKWETTTSYNVGLDYGFLNNRISGGIDVYFKQTKDLLGSVDVAPGANFDITLLTNVGNIENKGVEFSINTNPIRRSNFVWNAGFNINLFDTKITKLSLNENPNFKGIPVGSISGGTGNNIGRHIVGEAPYAFFPFKQVYNLAGKPIEGLYEDLNRDGVIDDNDRYLYKKPAANMLLGFNTDVLINNKITIGIAGHGSINNYLYNNYFSNSGALRNFKNPILVPQNGSRDYLNTNFTDNQYLSDYYISNASFVRIDNINFGYNAGPVFKNKANMRLTANIQNVAVFTKYKGFDPEVSSDSGVDNFIYPRPFTFTVGVNLDF